MILILMIISLTVFIYTIFSSDIYKDFYNPSLKNEKNENDKNKEFYDPSSFSRLKIILEIFFRFQNGRKHQLCILTFVEC
jgi:hypothetical protein